MTQRNLLSWFKKSTETIDNEPKVKRSSRTKETMTKSVSVFSGPTDSSSSTSIKRKIVETKSIDDIVEEDDEVEKKQKVERDEEEDKTPPIQFEDEEKPKKETTTKTEETVVTETKTIVDSLKKFNAPKDVVALNKKHQMSRASTTPIVSTTKVEDTRPVMKKAITPEKEIKSTVRQGKKEEDEEEKEQPLSKKDEETKEEESESEEEEDTDRSQSTLKHEHVTGGIRLQIRQGDITEEDVDAIVNAANEHLAHGGGVAGAVSRSGGPAIQKESNQWVKKYGIVETGQVAVTGPGRMICKCVIHAVGPVWHDGRSNEKKLLALAVYNSLLKANEMQLESISIPAISSGIFGFPKDMCAEIMFIKKFPQTSVKEIRFTNFDNPTVSIFSQEFRKRFG